MDDDMTASRRVVLAAAGAAATLGFAGVARGSGLPAPMDFVDQETRLRSFMLMRGALDNRLVIGFVSARYHGVVDTEIMPLFGVLGATFSKYKPAAGGGYEGVTYELPYFTDLGTGNVMDHFHNPYTGQDVLVPQSASPPTKIAFAPDLALSLQTPPPRFRMQHNVPPATQFGDDVWMVEESSISLQLSPDAKAIRYREAVTMHALASDLRSPGARHVGALTGYSSASTWRSWLKMGDHPGYLSANGFGRYGAALEDLPPGWLAAARQRHPKILADPGALLNIT